MVFELKKDLLQVKNIESGKERKFAIDCFGFFYVIQTIWNRIFIVNLAVLKKMLTILNDLKRVTSINSTNSKNSTYLKDSFHDSVTDVTSTTNKSDP